LKSGRNDLGAEDIWRTYILLSRVEAAFRAMKSPLCERPFFYHLERRVETHIFLCVLAYHLLVCIERAFRAAFGRIREISKRTNSCVPACFSSLGFRF
jgi:hypothetical protein